jgi:hypothetical protein
MLRSAVPSSGGAGRGYSLWVLWRRTGSAKAEIRYCKRPIGMNENVGGLEVAVDNVERVQMQKTAQQLIEPRFHKRF